MKTKNIFKALVMAMLMPAMLLTTACSSEDDFVNNTENTIKKGYELPVTISVTRQGDEGTTRATYNGTSKKLEFSEGDQLYVFGDGGTVGAGQFAGTLTWQSDDTFSGTIYTSNEYSGSADELLAAASDYGELIARLLPAGYEDYDFFDLTNLGTSSTWVISDASKAFALTKATAVEQFSDEYVDTYDDGFALSPHNAILNFTITGLAANTDVTVSFSDGNARGGTVKTDASGNATFAVGVSGNTQSKNINLTVDGNAVALNLDGDNNRTLAAGKIYNITRSAAPAGPIYPAALNAVTTDYVGSVVTTDGNVYATVSDATTASKTAAAMIAYVSGTGHGLAIALQDEGDLMVNWSSANGATTGAAAHTPVVTNYSWRVPTQNEWQQMFLANGGSATDYAGLNSTISTAGATELTEYFYWTSTEINADKVYCVWLRSNSSDAMFLEREKTWAFRTLACFTF